MSAVASKITLKPGQGFTDNASGQSIAGSSGQETVTIPYKINNASIANVGNVRLAGKLGDFGVSASGENIVVVSASNPNLPVAVITPADQGTALIFSDGSKATLSLDQGSARIHYDTIQLVANANLNLADGNVSVRGAAGTEGVSLAANLRNVGIDSKVEKVIVNADLHSISLSSAKGLVSLASNDGAKIADLSVVGGHNETLIFNDCSGALTLDSSGKGLFNLTAITLPVDGSFTATSSGISITATAASDASTVVLGSAASKEHISAAIGQVKFVGKFSDYLYQNKSGTLYVFDKAGHALTDIQLQSDANGTSLAFSDGSSFAATLNSGAIKIGAATVASGKPTAITLPAPAAPAIDAATPSAFQFALTLGNFGQYQDAIRSDMTAALDNIGKYLVAKGVFNVQVLPENVTPGIIADASGTLMGTPNTLLAAEHGANSITAFQLTSLTGTDPNAGGFDATVRINMANIARINLDATATPSANQLDLTTALTHEILHAIGFEGFIGTTAATRSKTAFDTYIAMQGGKPYFTGANAEAVYGGPVPLAPASAGPGSAYYHVDVAGDLMATSLSYGQIRTLSALDLAILKDIGIPEIATVGTQAVVHA